MRLGSALLAAVLAGCSYDWQIAPTASDRDASPGPDASPDATAPDGGPDCATLLANLDAARAAAKACTLGEAGQCTSSIVDECGCSSYVTQGGSPAAVAFAAAVHDVLAAKCATSCATCLGSIGACLLNGGPEARCVP